MAKISTILDGRSRERINAIILAERQCGFPQLANDIEFLLNFHDKVNKAIVGSPIVKGKKSKGKI